MIRAAALLLLLATPLAAQERITIPPSRPANPEGQGEAASGPDILPGAGALPGQATTAPGGAIRVLDKIYGTTTDLDLLNGETGEVGLLTVTMGECRVPVDNPAGDAFALVSIRTRADETALFEGWLIASAPALHAMDHPRYDAWVLRCTGI
jgi:hypothetical protein